MSVFGWSVRSFDRFVRFVPDVVVLFDEVSVVSVDVLVVDVVSVAGGGASDSLRGGRSLSGGRVEVMAGGAKGAG